MLKVCRQCGETKSLSEFYQHKEMADGHLNKCKECIKRNVRKHRRTAERPREYDLERSADPSRMRRISQSTRIWRERNPEKYKAHIALNNAIRKGTLKKKPCSVCGNRKSHGHHADYSKPLEVEWFCAMHHQQGHSLYGESGD